MTNNKLTDEQIGALYGALFDELQVHQRNGEGGDESYFAVQCEEVMSALRELQEYRKAAEPVAFRLKLKRACGAGNWRYIDHRQPDAFELENCDIEYLLSTTPAPAVEAVPVVPNEMTPTTIRAVAAKWNHELDDDEANAAADAWNACRDAMLQGNKS